MPQSRLVTDLNDRERGKYAEALDRIADAAAKLAAHLRSGDDTGATVHLALLSLLGGTVINDLTGIFVTATSVTIPNSVDGAVSKEKR